MPATRETGGLIIAGSYVPKTTAQLEALISQRGGKLSVVEVNVEKLISSPETTDTVVQQVIQETESHLRSGQDTLVMTSRKLITGGDGLSSLDIGSKVAEVLVKILQQIEVRPRYIIAKVCFKFSDSISRTVSNKIYREASHPLMQLPKASMSNEQQ